MVSPGNLVFCQTKVHQPLSSCYFSDLQATPCLSLRVSCFTGAVLRVDGVENSADHAMTTHQCAVCKLVVRLKAQDKLYSGVALFFMDQPLLRN